MALSVAVLKRGDFRKIVSTRICAILALQAQAVIVGWQVYSLTNDVRMLGLVGLVEAVPAILTSLIAGHVVDISRPHRVYVASLGVLALNALMLFLMAGGVLHAADITVLPWIFAGVFVSGVARSFIMPASFSMISQIVPRNEVTSAFAWLSSAFQVGAIAGPAIAGIIYGGYGPTVAWAIPLALLFISFTLPLRMEHPIRHYRQNTVREKAVKSIRAGWNFIFTHPTLLSIMALDMFAVLLGGVVAVLPAYADQVLHVGAEELGLLRAAPAVGAIATALYLALRPMQLMRGSALLWVVTGFGLCMIGIGLTDVFWVALVLLALSGLIDSVSMVMRAAMVQLLVPDAMRGRVSSVNNMFIISSNEIGAARAGFMAGFIGLVPSIVVGGFATLAVAAVTALASPKLRRLVVDPNKQE